MVEPVTQEREMPTGATPAAAVATGWWPAGSGLGAGMRIAAAVLAGLVANGLVLGIWNTGDRGLLVMLAVFLASCASSIAGFAFSAICGAMLFHLIGAPVQVVSIMIFCSIANQLLMNWSLRKGIAWGGLAPYLLGSALGIPVGLYVLLYADKAVYAFAIGALLIFYGAYKLLRPTFAIRTQHVGLDVLAGWLGGITGGAAAFPGAFVTIWCNCKGWDKGRQRAVYQPFILLTQITTMIAIAALHPAVARHGVAAGALAGPDWLYIPAGLLGTWCGLTFFARLNERQFGLAVNVLLLFSGLSLVI